LIAAQPNSDTLQVLNPGVAYNQLDGAYQTVGGSESAYNLSTYLGTQYINGLDVTFITGPDGPGDQDVWMTGYVDGECDIVGYDEFARPGECGIGSVSYPAVTSKHGQRAISGNENARTRLFERALRGRLRDGRAHGRACGDAHVERSRRRTERLAPGRRGLHGSHIRAAAFSATDAVPRSRPAGLGRSRRWTRAAPRTGDTIT
jgi:hypothetical protein